VSDFEPKRDKSVPRIPPSPGESPKGEAIPENDRRESTPQSPLLRESRPGAEQNTPAESPGNARRREHLARLLVEALPRLRVAARRGLTARTKSVYDSPDVASSVLRRMDLLAHEGRLDTLTDDEVIRFALTVASNRAVSRTRTMERLATMMAEDGRYAQLVRDRVGRCEDDEQAALFLCRIAASIDDGVARQLFMLRWKGLTSDMIGQVLGISPEAVRQRWSTLRHKLAAQLETGVFDEKI
jgi:DNA-directed RNA polymerase specialized sigma24 family protein